MVKVTFLGPQERALLTHGCGRTQTHMHTLSHVRDFDEAMEQKAVGGVE